MSGGELVLINDEVVCTSTVDIVPTVLRKLALFNVDFVLAASAVSGCE